MIGPRTDDAGARAVNLAWNEHHKNILFFLLLFSP